ncbi:MAG: YerC/YecD family TrpR-related protein [Candidatus Paceibacterota bacterium]|jgi:TrpR-related protein YerC/YecD
MKEIDWGTNENKRLIQAFLILENIDETKRFLRDIMTEKEIKELSNRLEAATLLSKDVQYNAIIEKTGLSSTTIARIAKWLKGPIGGYRLILNKLSKHHSSSQLRKGLL